MKSVPLKMPQRIPCCIPNFATAVWKSRAGPSTPKAHIDPIGTQPSRSPNTHQPETGGQALRSPFRRGEGGRCGVGWAFMVARGVGGDRVPARGERDAQDAGDPTDV